ncbi:unnamed protein product [Thelazia callipaeda]|uniref:Calponin-homology (CH) domain-containing protein n=1 Tax=Thelazia callipaeda TaxID=103827 RepID=A0A0N5D363_THECL|nr:unnamed protein product [Thelazia callipaeda]
MDDEYDYKLAGLHRVSDELDRAQISTFTKWINYHLETYLMLDEHPQYIKVVLRANLRQEFSNLVSINTRSSVIGNNHSSSDLLVKDLFEDLKDGVLLCHLIEVLTGEILPINKRKELKRVHHISNLTTALGALRRRGLDLVNNNPADIADGNPRIICGLIWQMILHFQIENNVQLLREWGFELNFAGSPSTSKVDGGGSPLSKLRVGRLKAPVDRVVLRWVNAQLAGPYNIKLADMDKSWCDGIAFNALIHRVRPELVDMGLVRRNSPKDNLEQAFRLSKEYLHIRPLLNVEDMLCEKPDKRSVITYVSQFIRTIKYLQPITTSPSLESHSLIAWIEVALNTLRSFHGPLYERYQTYAFLRQQYFEHQSVYFSIREHADTLPRDEWNRIEIDWKKIEDLLSEWNNSLKTEMPKKLADLVQWLCAAEQILRNAVEISADDSHLSLSNINKSISRYEIHFSDFPLRLKQFQCLYLSRRVDELEINSEVLEPLNIRFDTLVVDAPRHLQYLHRLQARYQLLSSVEALNQKMECWKSSDSAAAVQKSIKEYKIEADSVPAKRFEGLLTHLRVIYNEASEEDFDSIIKECHDVSAEAVKKFKQMLSNLDELAIFWEGFENFAAKIEERIARSERDRHFVIDKTDKELLRCCEKAFDGIASIASHRAQTVAKDRLSDLRKRLDDREKKQTSILEEASPAKLMKMALPVEESLTATTASGQDPELVRLQKWLFTARKLLSHVITDVNSLEKTMNEMMNCQRELQSVERERLVLLKIRNVNSEQADEYRKLRSDLLVRMQQIKSVRPLFLSFYKHYDNFSSWLNAEGNHYQEDEKKSEIINHLVFLLETFSRNEYSSWINCDSMRCKLDELKHRIETALVAKLLRDKRKLLTNIVEKWRDVSAWCDAIAEIDNRLEIFSEDVYDEECKHQRVQLEGIWQQKIHIIKKLQSIYHEAELLRCRLTKVVRFRDLLHLTVEVGKLRDRCMQTADIGLASIRDDCLENIAKNLETPIAEAFSWEEKRIRELSMVHESDVKLALETLCQIFTLNIAMFSLHMMQM